MKHQPMATDIGRGVAKVAVLAVAFMTLAGFTMMSHMFSNARAGRIVCVANQRAMQEASLVYQTEFGGSCATSMELLRQFYTGAAKDFGSCPANTKAPYSYDPKTCACRCLNPTHATGL